MQIRPATLLDVESVIAIYNDAVLHTTASYDYEPRANNDAEQLRWFQAHQDPRYPALVAVENDVVLGWGTLTPFRSKEGYRFTAENSIYVAAAHRRRGVGKLLLKALIEAGRKGGLHVIIACIDADNEVSIRLHAVFGFEQVGCLKEVGFKFDCWLDVVYMQLLLSPGNHQ